MQTDKWGSAVWHTLHCVALHAEICEKKTPQKHYEFFDNIGYVLPCCECQDSFQIMKRVLPLKRCVDVEYGFFIWTHCLHNLVNAKLQKKPRRLQDSYLQYLRLCNIEPTPTDEDLQKEAKRLSKLSRDLHSLLQTRANTFIKYMDKHDWDFKYAEQKLINYE